MFKGSIVALVTPFTEENTIDFKAFDSLVHSHLEAGTDGIVLCGTTGETPTLSHEEQIEIIKRGIKIAKGNVPIIVGTGSYCTRSTVEFTAQVKDLGADACLVIVPYYNKPHPEGCYQHFEMVSHVGLPMIIYHHPGRTGLKLSPALLARIAALPHVIGIKDCTMDLAYVAELMGLTEAPIFSGDDNLVLSMMGQGAHGIISVIANIIPLEWKLLCHHLLRNEWTEAKKIYQRYYPLIAALGMEPNPQTVKYALSLLGKCRPELRLPMMMPQEETQKKIEVAMENLFQSEMSGV